MRSAKEAEGPVPDGWGKPILAHARAGEQQQGCRCGKPDRQGFPRRHSFPYRHVHTWQVPHSSPVFADDDAQSASHHLRGPPGPVRGDRCHAVTSRQTCPLLPRGASRGRRGRCHGRGPGSLRRRGAWRAGDRCPGQLRLRELPLADAPAVARQRPRGIRTASSDGPLHERRLWAKPCGTVPDVWPDGLRPRSLWPVRPGDLRCDRLLSCPRRGLGSPLSTPPLPAAAPCVPSRRDGPLPAAAGGAEVPRVRSGAADGLLIA